MESREKLDSESGSFRSEHPGEGKLVRQLKSRHVAMMSIGGAIGTGLFLGTATSLSNGGPLGLLLGYMIVGSICYSVMISLGEMIVYLPIPGGHITLAERFVNPGFSFALGWNYWYFYVVSVSSELNGASVLINYWDKYQKINGAVWITIGIVVVIAINLMGAGVYGEAEFIFVSIKVITIVGLIILGIVLDLGGGPNHDQIGFRYWINPGPFVQFKKIPGAEGQFLGFWAVLSQAVFAFLGTEIISVAAGETKDPRRNLPKAIRGVYIRILLFYIGGAIIIGLLVPSNDPGLILTADTTVTGTSPFVIAIQSAGIYALPSIINACFLTSALSAASSQFFASSRAIHGLAVSGNAPRIFLKTLPKGLPIVAVLFNSCFTLLSYTSIQEGSSSGQVFTFFAQMTSIAGLINWLGIVVTYLRFYKGMKAQGYLRSELPYYSKFQPFAAWYAVCSISFILLLSGWIVFLKNQWATTTFVANYLPLVLFPILYLGARIYHQEGSKKPDEMDFVSNIAEIEAETYDETSRDSAEAFWEWCSVRNTKRGTRRNDKMRLSSMKRVHEYEIINAERTRASMAPRRLKKPKLGYPPTINSSVDSETINAERTRASLSSAPRKLQKLKLGYPSSINSSVDSETINGERTRASTVTGPRKLKKLKLGYPSSINSSVDWISTNGW